MHTYWLALVSCTLIFGIQACSGPDYTNDTALDLCDHMNIETGSNGYPHCFAVTAEIYNSYPKLDMQNLIQQADHVCDDAELNVGDKNYPSCFMRATLPLVKHHGIQAQNWESAMQKLILIHNELQPIIVYFHAKNISLV